MFLRAWRIAAIVSLLIASQAATAKLRFEQGATLQAASVGLPDPSADRVLGQAVFTTNSAGTGAAQMNGPSGIAIAPAGAPNAGRLFVAEHINSRVQSWPSAGSFVKGQAADLTLTTFTSNGGADGPHSFNGPEAAAVESSGRLWVADTENNRVLRFDPPFGNGMNASVVLGQPDFDSNSANQGNPAAAANTLYFPRGLAIDAAGNLYVADDANHRVLRFSPPFVNNMPASLVLGQANLTGSSPNRGGLPGQNTLNRPKGIAIDGAGNLYVAEYDNSRVTRYAPPLSDGQNASAVFGQPDYQSIDANTGGMSAGSLSHPVDVAVSPAGDALFVTDQWNVRVLGYANPLGDTIADQVYGQPDFGTATPNNGGVSANSINTEPLGVALDANGSLLLADYQNHRVLAYDPKSIGNGMVGSCTEAALDAALVGGGAINFNCGAAQINLSSTKVVNGNTTIDGGGRMTLSGQSARRLFYVGDGAILTLRNIVLTDGSSSGDGGAIYNDLGGTLRVESSTIRNSKATASGGAIVSYGPLEITNSVLEGNEASNGGALYPRFPGARTTIVGSVLRNNQAKDLINGWGGAILAWDGAPVTIEGSDIYNNNAQFGGGIYNFANSFLTLQGNTRLQHNVAGFGGGVYNDSVAALLNATLSENTAGTGGGVYSNSGAMTLGAVTLSDNAATGQGGGIYMRAGTATLASVNFSRNSASTGGGFFVGNGTVELISATFSANSAGSGGGLAIDQGTATVTTSTFNGNSAGTGGGIYNGNGTLTLTNLTLSGNAASSVGAGLFNSGTATLTNLTLSGNAAGGIGGGIYNGRTLTLKNTIVANSRSGGNCYNDSSVGATIVSAGYNIASDNTCALLGTGDRNGVDPLLTGLGNYGGPTKVHMLALGSPAIDGILGNNAPTTDQRGVARPQGGGYDIGAVERRPLDSNLAPRAYIPLIAKVK